MSFNSKNSTTAWSSEDILSSFKDADAQLCPFNPSEFLIPGWKGEGLISSSAISIKNCLTNLSIDAQVLFKKSWANTKSMKLQTYNEFLQFAEYANIDKSQITQPQDFFFHVQDDTSPLKKSIDDFFKVHCFRAVAIYLFKIKFIFDLAKEQNITVTDDILMNPQSFLGRIFLKNSSTELRCLSLQLNQFSWYRPSIEYRDSLIKVKKAFETITTTELVKLISTPKDDKIYSIRNYSHALSHKSFGLFLNDLLVKLPSWLKQESNETKTNQPSHKVCALPRTLTARFAGNHVSSIALSHWLSQEFDINNDIEYLVCPEFEGHKFIDGDFLKISQELQFLSFLTKFAAKHKYEIISFICKIMKEKYKTTLEDSFEQTSFFNLGELPTSETLYNRIILNITELPKTNPHHFLIQQIMAQKPFMKKDAVIYLMTNQKLFVPSHSDRVEQLLNDFKVEASFNFEELKGKGEIGQYVYVITRRESNPKTSKHLFTTTRKVKESCLSFEFSGNLTRFNKFQNFVDQFSQFIETKNPITTPIYSQELGEDIVFDFHHDAIIDGKLVSSVSSKESAQQAHPSFFKNLTTSSISLESLFTIEQINHEANNKNYVSSELLGINIGPESQYPLLLIVNQSDPLHTKIELTQIDAYRGKLDQYGTAFHSYFGLVQKHPAINLNVFREYFSSTLGNQIIQMQLCDGPTKLRAKLRSLMVPSFFASTQFMPASVLGRLSLLDLPAAQLKNFHPRDLASKFSYIQEEILKQSTEFPWHCLGLVSHFKIELMALVSDSQFDHNNKFNFTNPLIVSELVKLPTSLIYPNNQDVYIEYKIPTHHDLQLPLSSVVLKSGEDFNYLVLKNENRDIVHLHGNITMLNFIKYIIQNAAGLRIVDVLMNLRIPRAVELEEAMNKIQEVQDTQMDLLQKTKDLISTILRNQLTK